MPMKPKKPCKHPGCPLLADETYCEFHVRLHQGDRPSARERGYGNRWRKASKRFLKVNPLCKYCEKEGKLTPATVVDHIQPHRGDKTLFWDENNWQPLCKKCHDRKTMTEDRHPRYSY
ncbi:HNH endonuclease [Metallumcola ferriviriculae]|uniref:Putative HNH nuclease YajD n=1 Tax=Metallumcola ferriviriculae TaxID=3039180 RepID=A0AAU0UP64_9FIRM|nr:HNH endonuclease [Desulfitibacteraceae bacterium MK1]